MRSARKISAAKRLRFVLLLSVPWFFASLPSAIGVYVKGEPHQWLDWMQLMWPTIPGGMMLGQLLDYLLTSDN